MEVEHCIRADGEEFRKILHHINRTVNKSWPDDMNGTDWIIPKFLDYGKISFTFVIS